MDIPLLCLAVVPSIVLLVYIYKKDTVEKEPTKLLTKLFVLGAIATVPACAIEMLAGGLLKSFAVVGSLPYMVIDNLLGIALVEEFVKFIVLKKHTWDSPHFSHRFDAVVYAVVVSLGFATLENILYVLQYGVTVGIMRAIAAVPGHAYYGVFMGYFYGFAKRADRYNNAEQRRANLILCLAIPVVLHGIYDFLLEVGLLLPCLVISLAVAVVAIRSVGRLSKNDQVL